MIEWLPFQQVVIKSVNVRVLKGPLRRLPGNFFLEKWEQCLLKYVNNGDDDYPTHVTVALCQTGSQTVLVILHELLQ